MKRILVIDDDKDTREILAEFLEMNGYTVDCAADGLSGLRMFKDNPTRLVITDIIMPDVEGLEIIRELSRDYPDVKIIAISGGGLIGPEQYLQTAGHFGADHVFEKPLRLRQVLETIQALQV